MRKEKSCGAVVFRKNGEKTEYLCLLQRRSQTYSVPKGHTEPHEGEEQTAKRELFEEVGLSGKFLYGFKEKMIYDIPNGQKEVVVFLMQCKGDIKINKDEIEKIYWLKADDAKKVLPLWYAPVIDNAERLAGKKNPE